MTQNRQPQPADGLRPHRPRLPSGRPHHHGQRRLAGGHVEIGDHAIVGAFCGIHQFCRIGAYSFLGGYTVVNKDILPYSKTSARRARWGSMGPTEWDWSAAGSAKRTSRNSRRPSVCSCRSKLNTTQALEAIEARGFQVRARPRAGGFHQDFPARSSKVIETRESPGFKFRISADSMAR